MNISSQWKRAAFFVAAMSCGIHLTIGSAVAQLNPQEIPRESLDFNSVNVTHFESKIERLDNRDSANPSLDKLSEHWAFDKFDNNLYGFWTLTKSDGSKLHYLRIDSTPSSFTFKREEPGSHNPPLNLPVEYLLINFLDMSIIRSDGAYTGLKATVFNVKFDHCNLTSLRPLQGAAGLGEVAKKTKDIKDNFTVEKEALASDPIKLVRGLGNELFVVDHHHSALAWIDAGHPMDGTCQILNEQPLSTTNPQDFWGQLKARHWVRLTNANGDPIQPEALPNRLKNLPDDPYRTLAWLIRKGGKDAWCRTIPPTPFAEFTWADFLRRRPALSVTSVVAATAPSLWAEGVKKRDRDNTQRPVINAATTASHSDDARSLPGYRSGDGQCSNGSQGSDN